MFARSWLASSAIALVLVAPLSAQAAGRFACRADSLSIYNCGQFYNGTVTLANDLRGANLRQTLRIEATITAGRVTCRVNGTEEGQFEGPGMLAVEHEIANAAGGGYSISVWCPQSADDRPRRGTDPVIKVMNQRAGDYGVLEGRDQYEHPNTDSANGLTGTETITWSLRR